MTRLLDVNVLISLLDANHDHHAAVVTWFNKNQDPWASCPFTQNGYLQVVTQEKYSNSIDLEEAIDKLSIATSTPNHVFLSDDLSILDQNHVAHSHVQGRQQLTDIYLLALSVFHGAQFVTLDQNIPLIAVPHATVDSMYVINP